MSFALFPAKNVPLSIGEEFENLNLINTKNYWK